jgi:hypothetical protein
MCGVLHNSVRENEIEAIIGKRQVLAVGHLEMAVKPLLGEVGASQIDCRRGDVGAGHVGSAPRKPRKVHARSTADVQNRTATVAVKVHEPEQMVQLLEMVLVEIVEEFARPRRVPGNLEIMDMRVPVGPDVLDTHHCVA